MNAASTILRLVAILSAAAAVVLFFLARGKLEDKQAELDALGQTVAAKQAELAAAAGDLETAEESLAAERENLAAAKRDYESARAEMLAARQELTRTRQELDQARSEIARLEDETEQLRRDLVDRERRLTESTGTAELNRLRERISELEAEAERLRASARAAETAAVTGSSVPATGSTTAARRPPPPPPPSGPDSIGAETVVTSVSRDAGILILGGGPELGLVPGAEVVLLDDMRVLCKVRISKIDDTYTIANILPGATTKTIVPGMTVRILR